MGVSLNSPRFLSNGWGPPQCRSASTPVSGTFRYSISVNQKEIATVNHHENFRGNGEDVLRDHRGTAKAEIPATDPKGFGTLSDSLAIYKPSGTKIVDTATGMATVSGPERRTLADLSGDLTQPMSRGV